eukprot:TRINITY_DN11273_c0_g1_i1.p1 TRINITY_DN11273_c0_g1~~TRINITY_DN11273_c0_g1_i1.p1  ORF type:complete len:313 (-),score=66.82 TRINITY_DN11273_c0_g1_i1:55-993(-)
MCSPIGLLEHISSYFSKKQYQINERSLTVRQTLGSGSYSLVYLVVDQNHDTYALKTMMVFDGPGKKMALKEVKILQELSDHPNILTMYDYSISQLNDGSEEFRMLLEYFPRGNLANHLKHLKASNESLTEKMILDMFIGLCNGVEAMHGLSPCMVHRDIKPENIVLTEQNELVLLDFGSVASVDNLQAENASEFAEIETEAEYTSTPGYRPPELYNYGGVFCDESVDQRIDIWSLGCTLYALCFLDNPFDYVYLRGGSVKMAITSAQYIIPEDCKYSSELVQFIGELINPAASERPFINEVLIKAEELRDSI